MTRSTVFDELPDLQPHPYTWNDLIGRRFERLTAIGYTGALTRFGQKKITCQCSCSPNVFLNVKPASLRNGNTKSCGCLHREQVVLKNIDATKHGATVNGERTPEYQAWRDMLNRCYSPSVKAYDRYGGRGIRVYELWWHNFEAFLGYVGRRPGRGYSLERRDNDGHYEPGNVYWATRTEQTRNQSNTRRFEFRGELLTAAEISERTGIDRVLIYERIARLGWGVEEAATSGPGSRYTIDLYRRWSQMIQRCTNPNCESYKDYGGRGITICDRWLDFEEFAEDVGVPPSSTHTLDRPDNDRGYGPGNFRWATFVEQIRNRRNTVLHELGGISRTLKEWAAIAGVDYHGVARRLSTGWPLDEALGTPMIQGVKRQKFKP